MADRVPSASGRHAARERAVSLLYESEARSCAVSEIVAGLGMAPDRFAVELATGVEGQRAAIDELLDDHAHGWSVARMPALDRAILRVATFELQSRPDVPTAVVIDEAIELAKEYSTERSGSFVNGILVAAAAELRPD